MFYKGILFESRIKLIGWHVEVHPNGQQQFNQYRDSAARFINSDWTRVKYQLYPTISYIQLCTLGTRLGRGDKSCFHFQLI